MGAIASQIIRLTIVYSTGFSRADQWKHQSSASLAFVRGIHRSPVNSLHKRPVKRKVFPFDDVIVKLLKWLRNYWNVNIYCSTVLQLAMPIHDVRHFAEDVLFWNDEFFIQDKSWPNFIHTGPFDYRLGLVGLVPVWCQTCDKPLPDQCWPQ